MKKVILILLVCTSGVFYAQEEQQTDSIPEWKIMGRVSFIFNQSAFLNWASGGQNTVAGNVNIKYDFNYKKDDVNWDTRIISGYGLSHFSEKGFRKTDDRFELNSVLGVKTTEFWFFSFITNFKTQYARGYSYKKEPKQLVSNFFSPAYLNSGPGMLWKKSDDLHINIAPASGRFTFVNNMFSGEFGVEEGKNSSFSLGLNFSSYYKFRVMENVEMENILAIYSDYLENPKNVDVEYQTNIRFKVNKNIKMHMTLHTIVDDNASSKVQLRQLFGLGLNYSLHEKAFY